MQQPSCPGAGRISFLCMQDLERELIAMGLIDAPPLPSKQSSGMSTTKPFRVGNSSSGGVQQHKDLNFLAIPNVFPVLGKADRNLHAGRAMSVLSTPTLTPPQPNSTNVGAFTTCSPLAHTHKKQKALKEAKINPSKTRRNQSNTIEISQGVTPGCGIQVPKIRPFRKCDYL